MQARHGWAGRYAFVPNANPVWGHGKGPLGLGFEMMAFSGSDEAKLEIRHGQSTRTKKSDRPEGCQ